LKSKEEAEEFFGIMPKHRAAPSSADQTRAKLPKAA
jgi:hypothetical protein